MPAEYAISVNQAAELLGVTVGRIRQLLLAGTLPGRKLSAKAWVIDRRDLERFARKTGREMHATAS